jgi:hypothetical protein
MNFTELDSLLPIKTRDELLKFWFAVFEFRRSHRKAERELAHYVFAVSLKARQVVANYDDALDGVCYEFGALEAPGLPDDTSMSLESYSDYLWERLENIVNKIKN